MFAAWTMTLKDITKAGDSPKSGSGRGGKGSVLDTNAAESARKVKGAR